MVYQRLYHAFSSVSFYFFIFFIYLNEILKNQMKKRDTVSDIP